MAEDYISRFEGEDVDDAVDLARSAIQQSKIGAPNGVAPLGSDGKVPASNIDIPSIDISPIEESIGSLEQRVETLETAEINIDGGNAVNL